MADDNSKGNVIKGPWKRAKKVSKSWITKENTINPISKYIIIKNLELVPENLR